MELPRGASEPSESSWVMEGHGSKPIHSERILTYPVPFLGPDQRAESEMLVFTNKTSDALEEGGP